eukprot:CAMPEP_0196155820 /NCGR_PEP_ID=MMETSP0910-20130528/41305_1 /TAXON_ID=49265 /ORGANISM="Thalassiosira rotula, Strain GSO102" /LENGTH=132 /DNA_ID=CAMNT_0041420121 /DNA_START=75 /DNA_END=474 /DNA_ORIENTATION=-
MSLVTFPFCALVEPPSKAAFGAYPDYVVQKSLLCLQADNIVFATSSHTRTLIAHIFAAPSPLAWRHHCCRRLQPPLLSAANDSSHPATSSSLKGFPHLGVIGDPPRVATLIDGMANHVEFVGTGLRRPFAFR